MKINVFSFELACADCCMNPSDILKRAGLGESVLQRIKTGAEVTPAEAGRIAQTLSVPVLRIIEK